MAALIAVALFVAQAINFTLAVRDRREFRLAQATRPVATRILDALEREAGGGRPLQSDRGRIRRVATDPTPASAREPQPEVAAELRRQLTELGIRAGQIRATVVQLPMRGVARPNRERRRGEALLIAVEQPGRGWLSTIVPWSRGEPRLLLLLVQTLILYSIILLPVLWAARRISRPLRTLTRAAADFDPLASVEPLAEGGPADLRQLISAFNDLRRRVTGMLEEKDRMLGAIGHDLRTPLAALRVRIESVDDDADRTRMIDTVTEMNRTLDDILSLARIGRPSEPPLEVDLAALVDAIVEDFRELGQDVTFADATRLPVRLRANLMRRAVQNLIENALKYGQSASVSLDAYPHEVRIVVADDGPGIPVDQLASVFEPFTRLESSRSRETGGIGLGLALAQAIVRDAGGDISLTNRVGGGLAATIRLPR
jgi:signal transduction histidine kinase